ncbi:DUF5590 domain-containing protein [Lederbergia galactosidilytica]|uniref:Peptidase n=1 Tax=Lederbergia galactosidilytica TaxID=217031 RepID=A0A177ZP89_9BACI|nr:DUF5590 domain-containing protein [Lederbergia galactosidilytica]KRG12487.1 peptidase [Virgibacillus soli]MBP1914607.1 uncharacterized protein YpmB [Lederbergia galactosidilytica]OAK69801.1 peptidase [Lederbergia galactosidilytica]
MKKWILIGTASVFLVVLVLFVYIYQTSRAPLKDMRSYAEERAKTEAKLTKIDEFYLYNGAETHYVIVGEDKSGEQLAVWIPEKKKEKIVKKKMADGISKQDAIAKLNQEEKPQKIMGVRLGMEKNLPLWEISYLDEQSHLNYYYIHFDTGKWWRKIENL